MKIISDMLVTALYTVFVQNLVLSAGLGMSEAIRVSSKPGTFGRLAVMISGFSVVTSIICSLLDTSELLAVTGYAGRAAVYGGVLAAVYLVTAFIARFIFRSLNSSAFSALRRSTLCCSPCRISTTPPPIHLRTASALASARA